MNKFIFGLMLLSSMTVWAEQGNEIIVNCVGQKTNGAEYVETPCSAIVQFSDITNSSVSLSSLISTCDLHPFDLKLKAGDFGNFANLEVSITKEKKNLFGKIKEKKLSSQHIYVASNATSFLSLTYVKNGNGLSCEVRTK